MTTAATLCVAAVAAFAPPSARPAPVATPAPAAALATTADLRPALAPELVALRPIPKPAQRIAELNAPAAPATAPDGELTCLAEAVYYEARGETVEGQRAVAEVVTRRAKDARYPNTICGVVYQDAHRARSCQFSFACDGAKDRRRETGAWRRAMDVARYELVGPGRENDLTNGATHFHTLAVTPSWSKRFVRTVKIGGHIFYRTPGRAYQAKDDRGLASS